MNTEHRAQGLLGFGKSNKRQDIGSLYLQLVCRTALLLLFTELACNNDKNDTNNSNTVDHLFLSDQDFL